MERGDCIGSRGDFTNASLKKKKAGRDGDGDGVHEGAQDGGADDEVKVEAITLLCKSTYQMM